VGATGSELSFLTLVPDLDSGFQHTHKTHEEFYIMRDNGFYQVDAERIGRVKIAVCKMQSINTFLICFTILCFWVKHF